MNRVKRGERLPPLRAIELWADALGLAGPDRAAFIDAAHLAHAPEHVRKMVEELRAQIAKSQQQHALILDELRRLGIKPPKGVSDA
jgi:hypothetical protein